MIGILSLACLITVPHVLSYSRIFRSNDDDFSYDTIYDWRTRKDHRNTDLEAYVRAVLMSQLAGGRRRLPSEHQTHHLWPEVLQVPALHYHRPHPLTQEDSEFAVPPSNPRFFDPPRLLEQPNSQLQSSEDAGDTPTEYSLRQNDEETTDKSQVTVKRTDSEDDLTSTEQSEPEEVVKTPLIDLSSAKENIFIVAVVAGCSTAAVVVVGLVIYVCVRLQRKAKDAADVEYPAYGVTGPNKEATPTGDRRLAHSAQMYHYQLTKQQIIAMESSNRGERRGSVSEADSEDDENEEGDYTVYECPGLAPTGEMEVKNPLFQDETTPANNDQSKE